MEMEIERPSSSVAVLQVKAEKGLFDVDGRRGSTRMR